MLKQNVSISVEVRNRENLFFLGETRGVTSFDSKGQFDVLPYHSNLISVIKNKLILYRQQNLQSLGAVKLPTVLRQAI